VVVVEEKIDPVEYQKIVEEQLNQMQTKEPDTDKLLEERRLKRQAILAKYQKDKELANDNESKSKEEVGNESKSMEVDMELPKKVTEEPIAAEEVQNKPLETADTTNGHEALSNLEDPTSPIEFDPISLEEPKQEEEQPKEEDSDGFDMFSDSPAGEVPIPTSIRRDFSSPANANTMIETDAEGYIDIPIGTVLSDRYQVISRLGSGVFSKVLKAKDITTNAEVAVKVIRQNEAMKRVGVKEVEILTQIANRDPEDKFCCARLITHFRDRDFLCLVFSLEGEDLLEVVKKFGRGVGLSIQAVQVYAKQLFRALYHIKRLGLIHADLKPTNILVNENHTRLRLSDFGSAHSIKEVEPSPFMVTGWFRAPEIILGLSYGYGIDMWAAACALFEVATGKILFRGNSNNDMLRLHLAAKGRDTISKKFLKKGLFHHEYFDDNLNFLEKRLDTVTGKEYTKPVPVNEPTRDLKAELLAGQKKDDIPKVLLLYDLLWKGLTLDPSKRLTVEEALKHPFISS
jgi:serine/threonine-protein kinase PRP4